MKIIIVDTNIVFSSILNPKNNIGEIIFNNKEKLQFFAPEYLRQEIDNHRDKILELAQTSEIEVNEVIFQIYNRIQFITDLQIPFKIWVESARLVREIDMDDLPFVALTKYLDGWLWSGDMKLLRGLRSKGFRQYITTAELLDWIEHREE